MSRTDEQSFSWPHPWCNNEDPQQRQRLLEELRLEIGEEHVLFGVAVRVVAGSAASDDVMFELDEGPTGARFALVHLTWRGRKELPGAALRQTRPRAAG